MSTQPVGEPVEGWQPRPMPPARALHGRVVSVVPSAPEHDDDLYAATCRAEHEDRWTYMAGGDFPGDRAAFARYVDGLRNRGDGQAYVIVPHGERAAGMASLMRADPGSGVIEVGSIMYAPELSGTRAATEAMFLLAEHVFSELGYRRYEWKCDALNAPSRRAAARLGFTAEGIFRQHMVYKGRNRDTAWFAITDAEWARLRPAYLRWLADENFDGERQRESLSTLVAEALGSSQPSA